MIQPVKNFNTLSFRGASPQRKNDDLIFDDINRMFAERDKKQLEERQKQTRVRQNSETTRRKQAGQPSGTRTRSQEHKRAHSQKVYRRTSDGDVLVYTPTIEHLPERNRKKKSSPLAPAALTLALLLSAAGIGTAVNKSARQEAPSIPAISETAAETYGADNEILTQDSTSYDYIDVMQAVDTIKSDENLSRVFYNLIETKNNMAQTIGEPVEILEELLDEPWAKGVEIELVLPQIFAESSGMHYLDDGSVNSSYADCNGFMQISTDAEFDMNKIYFSENPINRDNPTDNLKLGIAYDSELLNNYFEDDMFNALAAYNCGPANARSGNYYGADGYAEKILSYYKVLKDNPQFTQMLLDGALDEYQNEFLN